MLTRLFTVTFWTTFLPLIIAPVVHHYRTKTHDSRVTSFLPIPREGVGLVPRIFNLAKHANVSVNGTCGSSRPEVYCRRPTDKESRKTNHCIPILCDPKKNSIKKVTDGSKDSWISPTLENGLEYEFVTITLDLKQVYHVSYVTLRAGIAPLPVAWILERSIDGEKFLAWRYFADTDAECRRRYGIAGTQMKAQHRSDDEVMCLINYSKFHLDNDELYIPVLNAKYSSNASGDFFNNHTLARYVRFRLQKIFKTEKDLLLRKKLFYSIRTIIIGGQCVCNGHASKCVINKATGLPSCECEHNTCGKHCTECCPMFNQRPWMPGTYDSAGECEKCQCHGHADECIYSAEIDEARLSLDITGHYRGGGECLNCRSHTAGVNCEGCQDGWYRPSGVLPNDSAPCIPCECHPIGSTGLCTTNDEVSDRLAGSCECKKGYTGLKCDECAPGWRNFPTCEPCPCNFKGSLDNDTCSVPCLCKENVEGELCDKCQPGYFGLSEHNPHGCTKCYCSGVTDKCKEANITYNIIESPLQGWSVTDLSTDQTISPTEDPDTGALYIGNYELPGVESYYWSAPESLCGSQLNLYGGMSLSFTVGWEAMRGDTSGQPTVGPNVILVGSNGVRIGFGEETFNGNKGTTTLSAPLVEDAWYIIPPEVKDIRTRLRRTEYRGASITREQFLRVLANLTHIMLRAKFHTDQVEGSLFSARIEPIKNESIFLSHLSEKCTCPAQYSGSSCESCSFSNYKASNTSFDLDFECISCNCNSHSDCDSNTGTCKKCEHNTKGSYCQECKDGFYGNATIGTPDDCKLCACPLSVSTNNFSPKCELIEGDYNASSEQQYICTECPVGYLGDHCEMCDEFYYGNPLEIGGSCQPCNCNDAPCNNTTGECLECLENTEGILCDKCKPLYYRTANSSGCSSCDCYTQGSVDEYCDSETGQCNCKSEYTGRRCDECLEGFGYIDGLCEKCECGLAAENNTCNPSNGDCYCLPGALPPKCDKCEENNFGLSEDGCQGCGCHSLGSESPACDIVSGQCKCKSNVTGRICDQCKDLHWGISSGKGCRSCDCDAIGSISPKCDAHTGQCLCKSGVGGIKCDLCLPNHYGFSLNGCSKCQECKLLGHICDPETGRCVCPPHTQGVHCQSCTPNAWGYQILKGCTPCNCDSGGSTNPQCNPTTGECSCRRGFRGTRCDTCDNGFYDFPFCKSCDCNYSGTLNSTCDSITGKCGCDDNGACHCKANVIGKKCDTCKNGTFGIQEENPNGCTACFCFGRSASCTQAGLHWNEIRAGRPRTVIIEYDPSLPFRNTLPIDSQEICYINLAVPGGGEVTINGADRGLNITNNLRTLPGDTEDVKIGVSFLIDTPVYWRLPQQFLGDKVLSYGGYLKFLVETEGGSTPFPASVLSTYPLVQLQGNGKIVLQHFPVLPSKSGRYEVRFHESLWQDKYHPDKKVSREVLMVALQNVQHILIRATDSADFQKAVLKDVSLDKAAATTGLALAGGVELCDCPPEYNSTSCQDPSIGFYRWYDKDVNTATILIQLVGEARPCECNNRSDECDIETGFCKNCAFNTGGPYCDRCGEGYYGNPYLGSCLSCPCPHPDRNFAISCQVHDERNPICHCKMGYTGKLCDRCAYGWFGYPEKPGGFCRPCECNIFGSVSDECDEKTGQCNCRPGIEGRDCSLCPAKTVLTVKGCSTCEDDCSGMLLKEFNNLTRHLEMQVKADLGNLKAPWKSLRKVEKKLADIKKELKDWMETVQSFDNLIENSIPQELKGKAKGMAHKALTIETRAKNFKNEASLLRKGTDELLSNLAILKEDIIQTIQNLNQYSENKGSTISDTAALIEANELFEEVKNRGLTVKKIEAEEILDYCTGLLNKTMHMNELYPELWDLKEQLKDLHDKINELEIYIKRIGEIGKKRIYQSDENQVKIKHLKEELEELKNYLKEVDDFRDKADNLLYDADSYLITVEENIKNLTDMKPRLENITEILQNKEGILQNLNPLYKNKYVKPAQVHAEHLMNKANEYKNLLKSTIEDTSLALAASKRYQDIVDDLEVARKVASEAINSELMYKIFPPEFDETVMNRSDVLKALSTNLRNKGSSQGMKNMDLRKKLEEEKKKVNQIEATIRETGISDNRLSTEMDNIENNAVNEKVQVSLDKIESIQQQLEEAKEKISNIKSRTENNLRQKMKSQEEKDFASTNEARKQIQDSLDLNRRILGLLNQVNETLDEKNRKSPTLLLSNSFLQLKNKITEARHAAQSIRLSLSSNSSRGCVRSFKPSGLQPTTTNRLVITLTLDDPLLVNRIIFFLPSSKTTDFMGVELADGNIRFVWDNGGGPGVVSKSLVQGLKKGEPRWYKIIVERISHIAKLWVYTEDIINATPTKNSSNPSFGRFDVGPNDKIWVGGLPQDYNRPIEILSLQQGLPGCLHSLSLDDKPIGLWNHYTDSTDSCSACEKGNDDAVDSSSYSFNGKGYSALKYAPKSIYNRYQFSVALKFKTYDDNSILFLAVSSDKNRYVALTLRDGRVVFQIGYGEDSQLEMSSSKKYNDGNWTTIEASRNFDRRRIIEKGLLKVENETKEAAPPTPPMQSQIPELATADYLVGGFPPGYDFGFLNLRLPKPFLGCLADVFIDKDIYNLLKGKTNGVGPSCSDKITKIAGFHGKGYIKLEATRLKKDSSFGLALRTLQQSALVLLANGMVHKSAEPKEFQNEISNDIEPRLPGEEKKRESYYSVSLVDGRIEVRINAGTGMITLVSQKICNDGRFHSIQVNKMGKKLELRVDDDVQSTSALPGGAVVVKTKDLYLGGVPDVIDASVYASDTSPFVGTIKDLLFNNELQTFDKPVYTFGVDIGRLGPENVDNMTFVESSSLPPQNNFQCYRSRKYALDPRAAKLGDSLNSFIQINFRRRGMFQKNFSLEIDFRTFHPNGLLFFIPGTHKSGKQKNFLVSALKNGQLQVVIKSKKKLEVISKDKLNNGSWHNIFLSREERKLTVHINKVELLRLKIPKKGNLSHSLFIGGIPENGIRDPFINKFSGFTGCVKNLKINNQTEDLIGELSVHRGVGQCFPQIEKGSYFSGDAYVAYKHETSLESLLQIELEFRTSEMNGILLSYADFVGHPALSLEINNGKIIFNVDFDANVKFRLVHEFISDYVVCDNKWHRIHIMYENDQLTMRVDQTDVKYDLKNKENLYLITAASTYIGGLPEHIAGGKPILETRDNFKGCMRNIILGNKSIDFTQINTRHNVLIGSCPANNNH